MTPPTQSKRPFAACALAASLLSPAVLADPCAEAERLFASDARNFKDFGLALATAGPDIAVVGSRAEEAYVFRRQAGIWAEEQTLVASDPHAFNSFGEAVGIAGTRIVIGSPTHSHPRPFPSNAGYAYVFDLVGGIWTETAQLFALDPTENAHMGSAVAIDGETIVAGAPGADLPGIQQAGAVHVFTLHGGFWWDEKVVAPAPTVSGRFGVSVAISGDTILVGSNSSTTESAWVFVRDGLAWRLQATLTASDGGIGDVFGARVALFEDTALVASPGNDNANGIDAGAVYVFTRLGGAWMEQQKLLALAGVPDPGFGGAVALGRDAALIGGESRSRDARVFQRQGGVWTESQVLLSIDPGAPDWFGSAVALNEDTAFVGAPRDDNAGGRQAGTVYVHACALSSNAMCDAGPDLSQACDGVQLAGSASDPGGVGPLAFRWTSSCAGTEFAPSDDVLDPIVSFGSACGVSCDLTLSVDAGNGALCSDVVHVEIDDATAPSIVADASDNFCVWSPRHWWACYERADFHPVVSDDCGQPTWRFLDCASDQPADGNGDGHTDPDCIVSPDGDRICVRAERQGGEPAGRTYSVTARSVDACGNSSEAAIGSITVPHDGRNHPGCRVTPRGGRRFPSR